MTEPRTRTVVVAADAPAAIGPYSHAVLHGDTLYCSGMIAFASDGSLVTESVAAETIRCLENLTAICAAAGAELTNALRMTIYTTQLDRFGEINEAYATFFGEEPPARVTIGVAALPKGVSVEIDAVVAVG